MNCSRGFDRLGHEQWVRRVRLQVEVGVKLSHVVQEDVVHGDVAVAQVLGAIEHSDVGKAGAASCFNVGLSVSMTTSRLDPADRKQGGNDVLIQRAAGRGR